MDSIKGPQKNERNNKEISQESNNQPVRSDDKKSKSKVFLLFLVLLGLVALLSVGIIVAIKGVGSPKETGQAREHGKNLIYNKEIKSITIKYYEGYNIATGEATDGFTPLNTVKLESKDFKKVAKLIKKLKKVKYKKDSEEYSHMTYDHLNDEYEIDINDDLIIYIGDEYGFVKDDDIYFKVSKKLYKNVSRIAEENSKKNLYKQFGGEKFTIIRDGKETVITDKTKIQELAEYDYYLVNGSEEQFKNEKIAYAIKIDNEKTVYVFKASVLGRIEYKDGKSELVYVGELEEEIDIILGSKK